MVKELMAAILKIEFQIGLVSADDIIIWAEKELQLCDATAPALGHLAIILSTPMPDDLIESLGNIGGELNNDAVKVLIEDLINKITVSDAALQKVAYGMESIDEIHTFSDKSGYFRCLIEDIESGVYGNMQQLRVELLEYFQLKLELLNKP